MGFITTHYHISSDRIMPGDQLHLIMISDLHNCVYGSNNDFLLQMIGQERPDLILIAGDMIVRRNYREIESMIDLMSKLIAYCPVCYAPGNHETRWKVNPESYDGVYERYAGRLKQRGIRLLENETEIMTLSHSRIAVTGLEIPLMYYQRFRYRKFTRQALLDCVGIPREDCYHILLAHHPRYGSTYLDWADLTLSGHLHGGILRLGHRGMIDPGGALFPKYSYGLYRKNEHVMIIGAGLGDHTFPLRVFNPKELICIDITNMKDE